MQNLHTYTSEQLRSLREAVDLELRERESKECMKYINYFCENLAELQKRKIKLFIPFEEIKKFTINTDDDVNIIEILKCINIGPSDFEMPF